MSEAITSLSATVIAQAVAARKLSAREVAQAFLQRVEQFNPAVNAICTLSPRLLEDAEACDRWLASGATPRPLEGVPFLVKDIIETKDLRTTFGSRLMAQHVPEEDAVCVERLRAAGGVLLGKTNTPEFAHDVNTSNFLFGTTRNPWHLMVTAGGSSGGSGAAVAAGFAPLAIGTDLGGSIRIPGSFNGISGVRPSPGRVPYHPSAFGWDTLVPHVAGPMALDVEDCALMLSVMAGPDDRDPASLPAQSVLPPPVSPSGLRIGLIRDFGGAVPVDPAVDALVQGAARAFTAMGCIVEEIPFDASDLTEIVGGTRSFGMIARYADRYDAHRDQMTTPLRNQIEAAFNFDLRAVTRAERMRTAYWHRVRALLERFDHLLAPSCGATPFRLDRPLPDTVGGRKVARFYDVFLGCYAFSITGLPIVALPCGLVDGLPVGAQLVGRRLREDLVLATARAYQAANPQLFRRPEIDRDQAQPIPASLPTPGMVMPR
jgi:amidase